MNERDAIILGALLHDIGKFVQRGQKNPKTQNYCHWGEEWFQNNLAEKLKDEQDIIRSAISNHHDGHPHTVFLADWISAGERISLDDEEKGDPFTDRLISIFSRISISNKPKKDKYHELAFLHKDSLEETFPIDDKKCSSEEYKKLLNEFTEEISSIDFRNLSPQQVINLIYFLLWKYTWCIPSAAYKSEPDVSLFDHLKTTAAIAVCLHDYHKENPDKPPDIESPAFCLIGGDISGIQSYILGLLTQQGKIAKRLRARSLFVQLVSEIAAHKILHRFNVPLCNLIMSAGGNFYTLVPNLKETDTKIEELQKEFDEWTLKELNAELSISLASIELSGKDLKDFSTVLDKLKTNLNYRKYQPHRITLTSGDRWVEKQFLRPKVIESEEKICQGCRKYPQEEDNLCKHCLSDTRLGQLLPKKEYLTFFDTNQHKFKILNYSFELWDVEDLKKNSTQKPYLVLALKHTNIKLPTIGFKYLMTHIPTKRDIPQADVEKEDEPVTFDDIANVSQGDKLLGYLKIDIDNLGEILRNGFIKPSISRFATFSRMLETFFSGYLQVKLEKDFKEIYTVFSGGDDLFVIGPWNRIIDLAKEIRRKFEEYCATNQDLTFSAGITLFKPHEPISFCAKSVDKALNASKERKDNETAIKDGVTIFNQTMGWDGLEKKVLTEANKIIAWLEKEPPLISRSFAYNLWEYGEMANKSNIYGLPTEIKTEYLKFVPFLTYDINCNLTKKEQKEAYLWAEDLRPSKNKPKGGDNLPYLKTIMEYVLTYTRR